MRPKPQNPDHLYLWIGLPDTPSDKINDLDLIGHPDPRIRLAVARSNKVTPMTLTYLSMDTDSDVRRQVAEDSDTPSDALARLARDPDVEVRISLCSNPSVPVDALQLLTHDEHHLVRAGANRNLARR